MSDFEVTKPGEVAELQKRVVELELALVKVRLAVELTRIAAADDHGKDSEVYRAVDFISRKMGELP